MKMIIRKRPIILYNMFCIMYKSRPTKLRKYRKVRMINMLENIAHRETLKTHFYRFNLILQIEVWQLLKSFNNLHLESTWA